MQFVKLPLGEGQYAEYQMYKAYVAQSGETNEMWLEHLSHCIRYALENELTVCQRRVIELYMQGYNGVEIAEELKIGPSTVSRTAHRGIARLTRCVRYATPATLNTPVDMTKQLLRLFNGGK